MKHRKVSIILLILVIGLGALCGCSGGLVERNEELVKLNSWFFASGIPNNAITVQCSQQDVTFELRVDKGRVWDVATQQYLQSVTLGSGDTVYWDCNDTQDDATGAAYVDIVVKANDKIVGYAVVKILQKTNSSDYDATVVKSVVFTNVGNKR